MRTDLEIFEMYKVEKAMVVGDLNERTGLEAFPTFKNWKEAYVKDYLRNHVEVSTKEADKLMDAAVELAEEELALMEAEGATEAELEAGAAKLAKAQEQKEAAQAEKKAKRAAKRKASGTRKTKAKTVKKAKGTGAKRKVNKAAKAREIFAELYPQVVAGDIKRKDVIEKFLEAGLTKAGSSTYYQKFKKEHS